MQGGTAGPRPPTRMGIQAETRNQARPLLRQPGSPPQLSLPPLAMAVRVNRERPVVGPWRIAPSQGVKGREWKVGVGQSKRAVCKRSMGTGRAGSTLSALACGMEATGEQAQLFPRMVGAGAPGVVAQHEQ